MELGQNYAIKNPDFQTGHDHNFVSATCYIYVRGGFNPSKSPIIKIWMFSDSI